MVIYDSLLQEYEDSVTIIECDLLDQTGVEGLNCDNVILIDKNLSDNKKKTVLAEELAHYETSVGNILDLSDIQKRKQEIKARRLAYEKIITLDDLIKCYKEGYTTNWEIADYLDVDADFLQGTLEHYQNKYGLHFQYNGYFFRFNGECLEIFNFFSK